MSSHDLECEATDTPNVVDEAKQAEIAALAAEIRALQESGIVQPSKKDLDALKRAAAAAHVTDNDLPLRASADWSEICAYRAYQSAASVAVAYGLSADTTPTELGEYMANPHLYRIRLLAREVFRH